LQSMGNLALSYANAGRKDEALKLREKTLAIQRDKLGADHPDTLLSMSNLAKSYAGAGRYSDALELVKEAFALRKAKVGPDYPDTLRSMNNLANGYAAVGRHSDAITLYEEVLARRGDVTDPDRDVLANATKGMARSCEALGRRKESAAYWARAQALLPTDQTLLLTAAATCIDAGDAEGYAGIRRRALAQFAGTDDPIAADRVAKACLLAPPPPEDLARIVALADLAVNRGKDHKYAPYFLMVRGMAAYRAGDWAAALDWCGRSRQRNSDIQEMVALDLLFEAMAHQKLSQIQPARAAFAQAVELMKRYRPKDLDVSGPKKDWLFCDVVRKEVESLLEE
jgi:Tetratricopeptide repeat